MFKKFSIGVLVVIVLALSVTGIAFAQGPTPPTDGSCPYGGTCGGYGTGGYGGMHGYGYQGTMPAILADALGMTSEELYAALSDGQTIAELAAAQGVEMDALVDALVAPRILQLEQAVADGYMTQEQADWMIEMMTTQMAWRLENLNLGYGGQDGCGMMGGSHYGDQQGGGSYGGRHGGRHSGRMGEHWTVPSTDL